MSTDPEELPPGWTPDVHVDEALVRQLLGDLPDELARLRGQPVRFVAEGWDNSVWRVGPDLVARVPRRGLAVALLTNEARWLAEAAAPLAARGVEVPTPLHLAPAGRHHRYPWLLLTCVPGELLEGSAADANGGLLEQLMAALPSLHRSAPPGAPVNPFRGPDLRDLPPPRRSVVAAAGDVLGADVRTGLLAVTAEAAAAAPWPGRRVWCHGDLHPRNIVRTPDGGPGLLDFGDLTAGDPAVDLAVLWTTATEQQRAGAIESLAPSYDEHVWQRAQGWAARFVLGVAGNEPGPFEATLRHAVAQLL